MAFATHTFIAQIREETIDAKNRGKELDQINWNDDDLIDYGSDTEDDDEGENYWLRKLRRDLFWNDDDLLDYGFDTEDDDEGENYRLWKLRRNVVLWRNSDFSKGIR